MQTLYLPNIKRSSLLSFYWNYASRYKATKCYDRSLKETSNFINYIFKGSNNRLGFR